MGYRSEVVFALKPDALEELEELASHDNELESILQTMRHNALANSDERNIYYHSWVKWYVDSDLQVKTIMDFFNLLDAEGRDNEYGYIRLGENHDDIDERGSPNDLGLDWIKKLSF
jgi:hypothetical protein